MGPLGVCEVNPGMGRTLAAGHVGREGQGGGAVIGAPWAAWQGGVRGWVPAPCGQILPKSGGWCSVLRCPGVWMLPARTMGKGGRVWSVPATPEPAPWKTLVSLEGPFWWGALIPSVSKHLLLPRGTKGPETLPKLGPQPETTTLCQMTARLALSWERAYQGPLFPLLWARDRETA